MNKQAGAALLIAMMALLSGSAFYLVTGMVQPKPEREVLDSLLAAKQALIAYAVNYADNYGHNTRGGTGRLPCPSLARNSTPARSCHADSIGYLPSAWMRDNRLMEIDYLERFLDRDIWYAVSADFRFNPAFNALNSYQGSNLLQVDAMHDVVAVLIAPGSPVQTQNRVSGFGLDPMNIVRQYLEGENADRDSTYTVTEQNDVLVPIRRSELIPLMERRVLGFVKHWLKEYKSVHGYYPYAAEVGGSGACHQLLTRGMLSVDAGSCVESALADEMFSNLPSGRTLRQTWFYRSGWPGLIYYLVDESCTPATGLVDCDGLNDPQRTLRVNGEPVEVILISVGEPLVTDAASGLQVHGRSELFNYLDTASLLSATDDFITPSFSLRSNDQLVFID